MRRDGDSVRDELFFRSWRVLEKLDAAQLNSRNLSPSAASLALITENLDGLHAPIPDLLASAETR